MRSWVPHLRAAFVLFHLLAVVLMAAPMTGAGPAGNLPPIQRHRFIRTYLLERAREHDVLSQHGGRKEPRVGQEGKGTKEEVC